MLEGREANRAPPVRSSELLRSFPKVPSSLRRRLLVDAHSLTPIKLTQPCRLVRRAQSSVSGGKRHHFDIYHRFLMLTTACLASQPTFFITYDLRAVTHSQTVAALPRLLHSPAPISDIHHRFPSRAPSPDPHQCPPIINFVP